MDCAARRAACAVLDRRDAEHDAKSPRRLQLDSASGRSASSRSSTAATSLGLLVLYHREAYPWTRAERGLARAFGDHMATAIGTAKLADSRRGLADRLSSIAELAGRLNGLHDRAAIGEAIVSEAGPAHRPRHDPRLSVDRDPDVRADRLPGRVPWDRHAAGRGAPGGVGDGLTGWVAAPQQDDPPGRRGVGRRGAWQVGGNRGPESMLLVPMTYEQRVLGVIVVSKAGFDQLTRRTSATVEIFAGYAGAGDGNAEGVRARSTASSVSWSTGSRASGACSRSTSGCWRRSTRAACWR